MSPVRHPRNTDDDASEAPRWRDSAANDEPDADDDACIWPVRQVVVPAAGATPLRTNGLTSVFDLGRLAQQPEANTSWIVGRPPSARPLNPDRRFTDAVHQTGVTRCTGGQYPSGRWTPEKAEHEMARRAKQRPPKPTRFAKSKSTKLRQFIKFCDNDWDA